MGPVPIGIDGPWDRTGSSSRCDDLGLQVPRDVSIVGFDDDFFAAEMRPALATVVLPHEAMARWAVRRLLGVSGGDEARVPGSGRLRSECPPVERASVAPVAGLRGRVRRAGSTRRGGETAASHHPRPCSSAVSAEPVRWRLTAEERVDRARSSVPDST